METGKTQLRGTSREGHTASRRRGWIGKLRSTTTQRAEGTARLITTIAVIVALIGGAGPAAAQVLVTNLSELSTGGQALGDSDFAQPFTTGTNASGYQLESISINFLTGRSREHEPVYVYVYGDNGNGRPNHRDQIATPTINGATFEGPVLGVNKYTVRKYGRRPAPFNTSSVHLDANTQYWVFVWAGEDDTLVKVDDGGTHETGAPGWSIGDGGLIKPEGSAYSNYTDAGTAMKIQVEGHANPEVLISVSDATATEGPDVTMDFVVSLSRAAAGQVTVGYETLNGTAIGFADYVHTDGTLTFQPGETSNTVSVPIIDDAVNDPDETFELLLSNPTGADIADGGGTGTGTIFNTEILTGSFENVPGEHDGSTPFTFDAVFNSDIGISYATLRDHSFTVTNGKVTGARRNNGRNDSWEITVTPWGNEALAVTLPGNRDCGTTAAICTKEDHPVQLSNSPSATVAGPPGPEAAADDDAAADTAPASLTASFEDVPSEHDGSTVFTFRLRFSEDPAVSYKVLRDRAFSVSGGTVKKVRRVDGRNDLREIHVQPETTGEIRIDLPATTDCDAVDAICTEDGRPLSHSLSETIASPVGISVADARVDENGGAPLAFAVTLSRAASSTVTVDYATADGSAQAGSDYTATSGTLTFAAGDTEETVEVAVLDDSHDEGEETMTLRLSNPSEGRLADAEATGTIENTDPLPRALLARFGRATALHVMEQVEERLEASRASGFRGRFAGRELRRGMERDMSRNFLSRLQSTAVAGARDTRGVQSDLSGAELLRRGLGGGDLLMGSGFVLNRETGGGASVSLWSRGMESRFSGRDGELSLDGGVRTTMFGADYAKGPLMAGLMLSHRRGLGGYQGADIGQVASSVTGLHPWVGYQLTERVTLWGVTGYGRGSLSLTPGEAVSLPTSLAVPVALKGGLSMSMLAGGVRGDLVDSGAGGFGLAFKADALWVETGSEAVDGPAGRLAGTEAVVTRARTALEASRGYVFGHGIALRPSLEVGLRRDGEDAETGVGADVAASLIASDPWTGLSVDVRVRTLLVHQDEGFRERGVSVSFSYDPTPQTPLGFTARVAPSWGGQAMSGADALWGRDTMEGLGAGGPGSGDRLDAEFGYALPLGSRLVGTPRFGVTTSEYGRGYRLGYGLAVVQGGAMSFQFGLDAQRRESLGQGDADHSLVGRLTVGW